VVIEPAAGPRADRAQLARLKLNPLLKMYVRFPRRDRGQAQVAPVVVPSSRLLTPNTVMLSIMAGRTLGFLEGALAQQTALVRAMRIRRPRSAAGIHSRSSNAKVSQPPARARAHATGGNRPVEMGN